jgi:hypothetical protein
MPALTPKTRAGLSEYISLVNQGTSNPLDVPGVLANVPTLRRTLAQLARDPQIDVVILRLAPEFLAGPLGQARFDFADCVLDFSRENPGGKQIVIALSDEGKVEGGERYAQELREAGITVYGSLRRACRAIRRFSGYCRFLGEGEAVAEEALDRVVER